MKAYRCYRCRREIVTDLDEWGPCRKCGSKEWEKLTNIRYWETIRLFIRTRFRLIIPPEGSLLEAIVTRHLDNVREECPMATHGRRRS